MKREIAFVLGVKVFLLMVSIYIDIPPNVIIYAQEGEEIQEVEHIEIEEPKEVLIETKIAWTEERIREEVWKAAARYNTFPEKMWAVMKCENTQLDPTLQSHHTYKSTNEKRGTYVGQQERSYGLAQIHLPDHPYVSYEQAIDPEFSIDFMAKHFANGNARWWSCYGIVYGK